MATSRFDVDLDAEIARAISEPDPAISNLKITRVHFLLSEALIAATGGKSAGANFHSWAIWGSRKAGVTIRQEDLDSALLDAARVAGTVGACVGFGVKGAIARDYRRSPALSLAAIALGAVFGAVAGRQIAAYSRREASLQILNGNRTVLDDIGSQTVRFLRTFAEMNEPDDGVLDDFLTGFRPGKTSDGGQDLLRSAFEHYYRARYADTLKAKHEALYFGNCLAVYHEHIRLQPCIAGSMPWIIRKCVTKRMMTFDVGKLRLAVSQDIAGAEAHYPDTLREIDDPDIGEFIARIAASTVEGSYKIGESAADWTKIDQRMRYILKLFRTFHDNSEVGAAPYRKDVLRQIAKADSRKSPTSYQMIISPVKTSVAAPVI